jgi:hypothetical protein
VQRTKSLSCIDAAAELMPGCFAQYEALVTEVLELSPAQPELVRAVLSHGGRPLCALSRCCCCCFPCARPDSTHLRKI